jgi:hypothetical protein
VVELESLEIGLAVGEKRYRFGLHLAEYVSEQGSEDEPEQPDQPAQAAAVPGRVAVGIQRAHLNRLETRIGAVELGLDRDHVTLRAGNRVGGGGVFRIQTQALLPLGNGYEFGGVFPDVQSIGGCRVRIVVELDGVENHAHDRLTAKM